MPVFKDGMTVTDFKKILDGEGVQGDDLFYVNGEYGKTPVYSIRRSVPIPMGDPDEGRVEGEDPYIILNG